MLYFEVLASSNRHVLLEQRPLRQALNLASVSADGDVVEHRG